MLLHLRGGLVEADQGAIVAVRLLGEMLSVVQLQAVLVEQVLVEVYGLVPVEAEHTLHARRTLYHLLAHAQLGELQLLHGVQLVGCLQSHGRAVTSVGRAEHVVVPGLRCVPCTLLLLVAGRRMHICGRRER